MVCPSLNKAIHPNGFCSPPTSDYLFIAVRNGLLDRNEHDVDDRCEDSEEFWLISNNADQEAEDGRYCNVCCSF